MQRDPHARAVRAVTRWNRWDSSVLVSWHGIYRRTGHTGFQKFLRLYTQELASTVDGVIPPRYLHKPQTAQFLLKRTGRTLILNLWRETVIKSASHYNLNTHSSSPLRRAKNVNPHRLLCQFPTIYISAAPRGISRTISCLRVCKSFKNCTLTRTNIWHQCIRCRRSQLLKISRLQRVLLFGTPVVSADVRSRWWFTYFIVCFCLLNLFSGFSHRHTAAFLQRQLRGQLSRYSGES